MNEDFLRWVAEKSWPAGVCQCVCVCVQAFPGTAPERLVRSGPGWHRSTRRNAGTTMVPVAGRPAARGTWHVPPREGLPKIFEQPYRSHGGHHRSETRRSHAYCTNQLGVPFQWGASCTRQGRRSCFDVGSSGESEL